MISGFQLEVTCARGAIGNRACGVGESSLCRKLSGNFSVSEKLRYSGCTPCLITPRTETDPFPQRGSCCLLELCRQSKCYMHTREECVCVCVCVRARVEHAELREFEKTEGFHAWQIPVKICFLPSF